MRVQFVVAMFVGIVLAGQWCDAQARRARRPEGPVYTDPKDAGPDFATQGEYVTDSNLAQKFGAQVVALGDGRFDVVVLTGGLPGDGWDGKGRAELKAATEGGKTMIGAANGYEGSISDGTLSLKRPNGGTFRLKRIERQSPRAGAKAPDNATILFDGTSVDAFTGGKMDERHLLVDGALTKKKYQDFTLHVEYILPFKPLARDQERGNSGVYLQYRYEVQILDTFGHPPEFNGSGSIYRQHAPSLNMCYPPLQWQTYDIDFHAANFDADGKKIKNATITLNQNGVVVQDHYEITAKTGAGHKEGPEPGPIWFQSHNNPVFFRNIWIVEKP